MTALEEPTTVQEKTVKERAGDPNIGRGVLRIRLIDFSARRHFLHDWKPTTDGFYRNTKRGILTRIDGSYLFNGGTEAWIDLSNGIQVTNFDGVRWDGPDGRFMYEANVGKMWSLILAAKMGDMLKWAKIGVAMAAIIILLILGLMVFGPQLVQGAR